MALWSKSNTRRIELTALEPLSVFSLFTAIGIIMVVPTLLILNGLGKIRLERWASFIPAEGFFASLNNPFTIALLAGIVVAIALGIIALIFALLYNCFASVMGGIKLDIHD